MAKRSGQEVRDLVDSMLDVSRLEEGEVPLQCTRVVLEEIMEAVQDQMIPRAEGKQMELTFESLPEIPELYVDSGMIRRVLINLVDNALKYTPMEGKVTVRTMREGDRLRFAISDNGPGISKADQPYIFNKFSRVDYSDSAPTGVGLGLAFCKLAAEAHGGAVLVESEGVPGQGSTFYLTIPFKALAC
jgi:signal transduction histidine kinase